ncbi:MAG: Cof-type HAD-IIB family hydrolase [Oscillospiraceae bacterium]|jgi:Cof subfamily protein (haloacid dehalogenase superfamily)|nr:Cof-type HAD-IIB family hydrolase [Oscillospiraceae bacterium]
MIRLIACDLDGTLLSSHDLIHPDNKKAICAAQQQGVHFVVASGRSCGGCSQLLKSNGMDAMIIGVNGCEQMDAPFGALRSRHFLRPDAARAVVEALLHSGLDGCIYGEDGHVYTSEGALSRTHMGTREDNARRAAQGLAPVYAGEAALEKALEGRVMKAFCIEREGQGAAFAAAKEACAGIAGVSLTSSWADNFEVMPEGVDKGVALAELCARLGIEAREVLAFGDGENDWPMLQWAGFGYVMGNAGAEMKRGAKFLAGDCSDGGVGKVVWGMLFV